MIVRKLLFIGIFFLLSGCQEPAVRAPELTAEEIASLIPNRINKSDKQQWAQDMATIMSELDIYADPKTVCSVIAVIDQESNFVADPPVANLGKTSLKALDDKLEEKLGKTMAGYFRKMLDEKPTKDNSFAKQIKQVKTERQLDELFREMFAYFGDRYKVGTINKTAKLLNSGIDEKLNPITTLGSMQVHIDYAKNNRRRSMNDDDLRDDLYSRYGGMYYGIHRLLKYDTQYPKPLYRFADYNSGVYSSRNAAFQTWVQTLGGQSLALDGDLLVYDDGTARLTKSQSETAIIDFVNRERANIPALARLTPTQIRQDLKKEKLAKFEESLTYITLRTLYEEKTGKKAAYAVMPQVVIDSPKLKKDYNTNWYATSVDKRYQTCLRIAKKHGFEIEDASQE